MSTNQQNTVQREISVLRAAQTRDLNYSDYLQLDKILGSQVCYFLY